MKRRLALFIGVTLFFVWAHRLPAPIQEQSPTPAPQESTKPKPKGPIKPRVTSETSEGSTTRSTSSATKTKAPSNRNRFDGVWSGKFGESEVLITITGSGTAISYLSVQSSHRAAAPATCDTTTARWTLGGTCAWTFTPNPDGKTALAIVKCSDLFGYKGPAIVFRKVSQ